MIRVNYSDEATIFFDRLSRSDKKYLKRTLKHLGFVARNEIQNGLDTGNPGGRPYKGLGKVAQSQVINKVANPEKKI